MMNLKEKILKIIDDKILIDGDVMTPEELAELNELRNEAAERLVEVKVTTRLYGAYCPTEDKTFVMLDTFYDDDIKYCECVGWYCGEPDEKANQMFSHGGKDLIASYDL